MGKRATNGSLDEMKVQLAEKLKFYPHPHRSCVVYIPFVCQECGNCCKKAGSAWKPPDIKRASRYLGLNAETFVNKYLGETFESEKANTLFKYALHPENVQPCTFLSEDNRCEIYPARPRGCRLYPLLTDRGALGKCPALERVMEIAHMISRETPFMTQPIASGSSLFPIHKPEDVSMMLTKHWTKERMWTRFLRAKPSEKEKTLFKRWNFERNGERKLRVSSRVK